jgi:RimJ/RimL family protein N-acetyltransferase
MLSFREIQIEDDAELILRWRTSNRVSRFMSTEVDHDIQAHTRWLKSVFAKKDYYHWIIEKDNRPVGLINLHDYSERDETTSWGLYIGEENLNGLGAVIPPYFYNFIFGRLGVRSVNAETFYNNTRVIGLHLFYGYNFRPDRDQVIWKSGKQILLVAQELTADCWKSRPYSKYETDFPIKRWGGGLLFYVHNTLQSSYRNPMEDITGVDNIHAESITGIP